MINKTSLSHLTMQAKLFAAMRRATLESFKLGNGRTLIKNKQGKPSIEVRHSRQGKTGFVFVDVRTGKIINNQVKMALRSE